ncbi:O-methyltransferase [Tissierella sp.]|uniref:O-methyltransferase n=1 Tax=Tissierella sp. TaxID=41274 RepID=UPI002864C205|nr:O-methyltransferase [Tissierella sp.]MDR7856006.1 O-methyltransferase [Tissierella sp.]
MIKLSQINEEYIEGYIRGLLPDNNCNLKAMEKYAEDNHVPIVQPEVAQLLKVLLKIKCPKNILEIGTAIGYSALIMAENTSVECKITTIERRKDMIELAIENISKTKYLERIKILEGEAEDILSTLEEKYDFIFLDAAKGQYMDFFKECIRLLNPGGIIVSDNVLYKGMVATDDLVIRRKKTIVKRLRQFLQYINHIEGYTSSIIPIGDGIAITYREE